MDFDIAYNFRISLTKTERAEQIAEWDKLTEEKLSAQLASIESKRPGGRGCMREPGINAAVREPGIDRTEAQRADQHNGYGYRAVS